MANLPSVPYRKAAMRSRIKTGKSSLKTNLQKALDEEEKKKRKVIPSSFSNEAYRRRMATSSSDSAY